MKVELHPCFLLHKKPYRETSLLLDVFSMETGRINLVARGVRTKNKNNQQAILQPFQKLVMSWSGKGEMGTLNKVEMTQAFSLSNSLMMSGFYMNELIIRLLHKNESHTELFSAYEKALILLMKKTDEQLVLREFEKQLLNELGYGLVLDHDVMNLEPICSEKNYYYLLESGPSEEVPKRGGYIKLSGETLIALDNNCLKGKECLLEARALMRSLLKNILGSKPLASRQLYQSFLEQS